MDSIKKNNSGFTLLELLITIVIIGIVAVPFINSFIQAININVEARRIQNATLAAQDMAEEFKSRDLEALLNDSVYSAKASTTAVSGSALEVHKFTGIEVKGADGEKFYIDVTLDPNAVLLEGDTPGETVSFNGGLLPMFSGLYGGNTQMLFKEYMEGDSGYGYAEYTKSTDITIQCKENKVGENYEYTYTFLLSSNYTKVADGTVETFTPEQAPIWKFSETDMHSAYLLAPVFDESTNDFIEVDGTQIYCGSDKIAIKYTFVEDATDPSGSRPDFTLHIAEQAVTNTAPAGGKSRFKPANIEIFYDNLLQGTLDTYSSTDKALKINTNIGKVSTMTGNSLTYSEDNVADSLFLMTVDVHYGKADGEIITSFKSTKEE